jgi:hypothetical protein
VSPCLRTMPSLAQARIHPSQPPLRIPPTCVHQGVACEPLPPCLESVLVQPPRHCPQVGQHGALCDKWEVECQVPGHTCKHMRLVSAFPAQLVQHPLVTWHEGVHTMDHTSVNTISRSNNKAMSAVNHAAAQPTARQTHLLYSLYPICCRKSRHDLPLSTPSACH